MEIRALKITVILIVFLFAMTSFTVMTGSSEHVSVAGNRTDSTVKPLTSDSNVSNEPYVKYTLVLLNNTLVKGNFLSNNGVAPFQVAFDSSNGYVYVANSGYGSGF